MSKEFIWVQKYRPTKIKDIIVNEELKQSLGSWIEGGEIPNLLLTSIKPGTGKTSLAHVLIHELNAVAIFLNASLENNIDTLRNDIMRFCSTSSFDGRAKIIVLDEADGLNINSTQPALRGFIEEFSKNARFILTANNRNKIIEPLRDRLIEINFDEMFHNHKELIKPIALRCMDILKIENIEYKKEDLFTLIKYFYPSTRSIIMKLQECSTSEVSL